MKFKLGLFENARTFFSTKGNTTVIRDTFVNQTPPTHPEPIKDVEIEVEEIINKEPTPEILVEETLTPKNTKKKNERY